MNYDESTTPQTDRSPHRVVTDASVISASDPDPDPVPVAEDVAPVATIVMRTVQPHLYLHLSPTMRLGSQDLLALCRPNECQTQCSEQTYQSAKQMVSHRAVPPPGVEKTRAGPDTRTALYAEYGSRPSKFPTPQNTGKQAPIRVA